MVCRFLRQKTARIGKDSNFGPGERRGTLAAVMGFENYGLLLYARPLPIAAEGAPPPQFADLNLVEDIPYRDGVELQERYVAAVDADVAVIDLSTPRLFWTGDDANLGELGADLLADVRNLAKSEQPIFTTQVDGCRT
jgi:hypothetical protein